MDDYNIDYLDDGFSELFDYRDIDNGNRGGDNNKEANSNYFEFVEKVYYYFLGNIDKDIDPQGKGLRLIENIIKCKFNPNPLFAHSVYRCKKCQLCCRINANSRKDKIRSDFPLASASSPHLSICLTLPRMIGGSRWKGLLGELLYAPSGSIPSTNSVISGFRKVAFESVRHCFPDLIVGAMAAVHLDDLYMNFSPHLHIILCGTGLLKEKWPLEMRNGAFPDLPKSWRTIIGRNFGKKAFENCLRGNYADSLATYVVDHLKRLKSSPSAGLGTFGAALSFVKESPDLDGFAKQIRQAVLNDPAAVHVKAITTDKRTGKKDPVAGLGHSIRYNLSGPNKGVTFRQSDHGNFVGAYYQDKKGKWKSCGPLLDQYRKFIVLHTVTHLRRYERYGYVRPNWGKEYQHALRLAMSKGYPR